MSAQYREGRFCIILRRRGKCRIEKGNAEPICSGGREKGAFQKEYQQENENRRTGVFLLKIFCPALRNLIRPFPAMLGARLPGDMPVRQKVAMASGVGSGGAGTEKGAHGSGGVCRLWEPRHGLHLRELFGRNLNTGQKKDTPQKQGIF